MGTSVTNAGSDTHIQPNTGLFELKLHRHQANISVDAWTTACNRTQWRAITQSAKSSDTDAEFAAVLATVWPSWTADHVTTPGLESEWRYVVLGICDP